MKKEFFKYLPVLLLAACYSPEPYVADIDDDSSSESSTNSEIGKIFVVNGFQQICNPSVSQDTVNYPASMLWLNFSHDLGVKSPNSEYNVNEKERKILQHDRLTISNTSEKVLWYLMRDTSIGDCQFQDPEWSTHPNFIASLRAYDVTGSKSCSDENLDYGIIAVRISDKKRFVFYEKKQSLYGNPHIWVDPTVTEPDTSVSDTTIKGFFGTDNVRLVFVTGSNDDKNNKIVFRDFAKGGKEIKLNLPQVKKGETIDNPVISPDGRFVVYNVIGKVESIWEAYIQELSENSVPIQIETEKGMLSAPAQPRWFKFGDRLFVVWAEFPSGAFMTNQSDYRVESIQDGSAGRTAMREIRLASGTASDLTVEWVGDVREISKLPMIGGRSPDGRYLATGTSKGFLIELP